MAIFINGIKQGFDIDDNLLGTLGSNQDIVLLNRSTTLSADSELSNVIVGTSDHQGVADNSLIISNITTDGDMLFLVSDGGNSKEFLLVNADIADLQLGHGMATVNIKTASGNLTLDPTANLVVILTDDAGQALLIQNSSVPHYTIDTRNTFSGIITHVFGTEAATLASGTTARRSLMRMNNYTLNYTGTTQVTSLVQHVIFGATTLAGDTATLTVDKATTIEVVAPTEGTNVILTDTSAIRILNASGTPTNQYGIYIEDLTNGATADYGIYIVGADTYTIWVDADPVRFDGTILSNAGAQIICDASGNLASANGATFGASDATSFTVVNGIITAIS